MNEIKGQQIWPEWRSTLTAIGGSSVGAVVRQMGGVQRTTQSVAGFSLVPVDKNKTKWIWQFRNAEAEYESIYYCWATACFNVEILFKNIINV